MSSWTPFSGSSEFVAPQLDGFPVGQSGSSFAARTGTLMRVLAAAVVSIGFLTLALWAAVWLAVKLL
jgi:hypothetical protein